MRVAYVAGDGPLQGWAYGVDRRLQLNEELELSVKDWVLRRLSRRSGLQALVRLPGPADVVARLPATPCGRSAHDGRRW